MFNQTLNVAETSSENPLSIEYLTFRLGDEEYGVDIYQVQELRGYDSVTRIANAKEHVKGVINLRGTIVPIVDMRIKLHTGEATYTHFTVVIVLNVGERVVGIVADGVSEVITFAPDQIKAAPDLGHSPESNYVVGIGTIGHRLVTLVDIEKMLVDTDLQPIERLVA